MTGFRFIRSALFATAAIMLAGCNIEATTPMRTFDIKNVAQTGVPVAVNAMITASFASKIWCEDEGAMALMALSTPNVQIRKVSCMKSGKHAVGQFRLTTSLVRTEGAKNPGTVVEEVLAGDLVRFAVFPHGTHKHLLSVGIFLDVARLEAAKAKLLAMPVFKRGGDTDEINLKLTLNVSNDLPGMAKFHVGSVSLGGDMPADEAVMQIPNGGSNTITLDEVTQNQLMQQGWVNFFVMDAR